MIDREGLRIFGDMGRILLVGEAPNRRMHLADEEQSDALDIPRLYELSGLDERRFRNIFARTNLLSEWPGASPEGVGDSFPFPLGRREAGRLNKRAVLEEFDLVVFLGRRVAACFSEEHRENFPWFEWRTTTGTCSVTVPHPSGASRWWNDEENVQRARTFWRRLAEMAPHSLSCCKGRRIFPLFFDGRREFPCAEGRRVRDLMGARAEGGHHADFQDYNAIRARVQTDGCSLDVRLSADDQTDWQCSIADGEGRFVTVDRPEHVKFTAYGKTGAERKTLADAFEWIARMLREGGAS